MLVGLPLIVAGMLWLVGLSPDGAYASGPLPSMLLFGLGAGLVFMPLTLTILSGVRHEDSGAASGLLQTTQQVGGSLGMAVLVAVYGTATRHGGPAHGMSTAFAVGALFTGIALLVALFVIRPPAR